MSAPTRLMRDKLRRELASSLARVKSRVARLSVSRVLLKRMVIAQAIDEAVQRVFGFSILSALDSTIVWAVDTAADLIVEMFDEVIDEAGRRLGDVADWIFDVVRDVTGADIRRILPKDLMPAPRAKANIATTAATPDGEPHRAQQTWNDAHQATLTAIAHGPIPRDQSVYDWARANAARFNTSVADLVSFRLEGRTPNKGHAS